MLTKWLGRCARATLLFAAVALLGGCTNGGAMSRVETPDAQQTVTASGESPQHELTREEFQELRQEYYRLMRDI